jgi:ornithine cyclodeaminase/alanine dehydrogenase-like protein (mu-crystallin family)
VPDAQDVNEARGWLDAVEAALVANALRRPAPDGPALTRAQALAGRAAVAAKFLAVGTPRTLGLAGCGELAPLVVAAQHAYAAPRELRVFEPVPVDAARVANVVGGRVASLAEACACDIVVAHGGVSVRREWIRGGTLVTVLDPGVALDPALLAVAQVYGDRVPDSVPSLRLTASLGAVAAGLVDGRSLDEIIVLLPS